MKRFPVVYKVFIIHIIFLVLHYLYDWFPSRVTAIFSGINESVYQHMKIGFFTIILFAFIEYLLRRKSIRDFDRFIFSKLFSTSFFPLVMMVVYLLGPLTIGQSENILFEIIFANIALIFTSLITLIVEMQLQKTKPTTLFRAATIILFILSFSQYTIFTYQLPWFDIFAIPPGY